MNRRAYDEQTLCPISFKQIQCYQRKDATIQKLQTRGEYSCKLFGKYELWVCKLNGKERVMVPESLQHQLMEWFHENLSHPWQKRMYNTMAMYYTWKGMKRDVEYFVSTCVKCQKFKRTAQKKYAKLPLRDDIAPEPFHTLQVDLIGPWNVEVK